MTISYSILLNDPNTHIVTMRWQDGNNYRDEAFDLNWVYPGATKMFSDMGIPFDYDAALTYMEKMVQGAIDSGNAIVAPPNWDSTLPFQQIIATTPEADRPTAAAQTPTTDPNQGSTGNA